MGEGGNRFIYFYFYFFIFIFLFLFFFFFIFLFFFFLILLFISISFLKNHQGITAANKRGITEALSYYFVPLLTDSMCGEGGAQEGEENLGEEKAVSLQGSLQVRSKTAMGKNKWKAKFFTLEKGGGWFFFFFFFFFHLFIHLN